MGNKATRQQSPQSKENTGATPNPRSVPTGPQLHSQAVRTGTVNPKPASKTPRLITACIGGNYRIVKTLLERGDDVNVQDNDGVSPLMAACANDNIEVVELVLNQGAALDIQNNDGWSPLMGASHSGHNIVVKALLGKGAEVNVQDKDGYSSLMLASQNGHSDICETLLDHGAVLNMQDNEGYSSLTFASQNGHSEVVKTLLDKGAEVNIQSSDGWSPLMVASQYEHNNIIKRLLNKGAEVNMQDNEGWSSLMFACQKGHSDIIQTLLGKGAEVNMLNNLGFSSLILSSKYGHIDDVKRLLDEGAQVNIQGNDGWSALILASEDGHNNVVKILLEKGAEVNMQSNDGATSLMFASRFGHSDVVKTLLDKGAEVNMLANEGWSSLMLASLSGHSDTVKLLLDNNADISVQNDDGETALDVAIGEGHENVFEILAAAEQASIEQPLAQLTPHLESTGQRDDHDKDATTPAMLGAQNKHDLTSQEEDSRVSPKHLSEPHTLGDSKLGTIIEVDETDGVHQNKSTATATADHIANAIGMDLKQLDQPFSEDLLFTIARLFPNWMEYANPLKMTPQEINGINTDFDLTYAMKSYQLLKTWYRKNAYTERCHYRVLVEASCNLGYADIAGEICKLVKEQSSPVMEPEDSSVEYISKDLILFKEEGIGGGAYGAVFKGEMNGQPCAIKVLHLLASELKTGLPIARQTKQDTLNRFRQECEYLETFKHPNVVCHLATKTHPRTGLPVLALELMDCSLRQFFSSPSGKDLPLLTQKSLCHDIASALEYIHSRHIVHRDLCSDNILLDCKGETPVAKVCDFGMSRIIKSEGTSISLPAFGHRGYLPPEATDVDSTRFDSSFDIFAFGAIMVQIVNHLPTIKDRKERTYEFNQIDSTHPLKAIIEQCLLVNRDNRLSAVQLKRKLM